MRIAKPAESPANAGSVTMREFRIILTTIMFYTIVPVPAFAFRPDYLQKILRYSSLVGAVIGAVGAFVYWCIAQIFSPGVHADPITTIGALLVITAMTGCLHEDGFADLCDGLATHGSLDRKLNAMRDSRIGSAGATGLVLMLALKIAALCAIDATQIPAALIVAHSVSRFAGGAYVFTHSYARARSDAAPASGNKPIVTRMTPGDFLIAGTIASCTLLLLPDARAFILAPILAGGFWMFGRLLEKNFGGYTGDCLGAAQQLFEVMIYLTIAGVYRIG